ncbi:hypothetical protein VTG60DRAFT_5830 [Thermothelomyces hinnuleus]
MHLAKGAFLTGLLLPTYWAAIGRHRQLGVRTSGWRGRKRQWCVHEWLVTSVTQGGYLAASGQVCSGTYLPSKYSVSCIRKLPHSVPSEKHLVVSTLHHHTVLYFYKGHNRFQPHKKEEQESTWLLWVPPPRTKSPWYQLA